MADDFRARMLAITDELLAQRVSPYTSAPPIHRLAWRLGFHVRPPLYQPFAVLALGMGLWMAPAWGLLMWFIIWPALGPSAWPSPGIALFLSIFMGTFFGFTMAAFYRSKARKLRLPPLDGGSSQSIGQGEGCK